MKLDSTSIIGIDCSTNPRKLGLARGIHTEDSCEVLESSVGAFDPVEKIARWVEETDRCLIAIDAPLGWPAPMGNMLASHKAGEPLPEISNLADSNLKCIT